MKTFIVFLLAVVLTGCGTLGGTISGAGKDLSRAGDWIQSK
jgi:predicted small secreted protein